MSVVRPNRYQIILTRFDVMYLPDQANIDIILVIEENDLNRPGFVGDPFLERKGNENKQKILVK